MTERPILMQGDMVNATLDGRKTQTRRVVKAKKMHPDYGEPQWDDAYTDGPPNDQYLHVPFDGVNTERTVHRHYARFEVGDLLWVRETYCLCDNRGGKPCFRASFDETTPKACDGMRKWKSPRYMFKSLARLWLKVKSVRGERVQDISIDDIRAEGVTFDLIRKMLKPTKTKQGHWISGGEYDQGEDWCCDCAKKKVDELNTAGGDKDYTVDGGWENHDSDYIANSEKCECLLNFWPTGDLIETELEGWESYDNIISLGNEDRYLFDIMLCAADDQDEPIRDRLLKLCWRYLWDSINAKRGYGWDKNPWVWVIEFERLEKK